MFVGVDYVQRTTKVLRQYSYNFIYSPTPSIAEIWNQHRKFA